MKNRIVTPAFFAVLFSGIVSAHHSFAPYDIRNPVDIAGVTESFDYKRPHPILMLLDEEGVTWEIEVPILFWQRAGLASDAIKPGDNLIVKTFPARNGSPEGALAGFESNGTYHSVHEQIRQRSAVEAANAIEDGQPLEEVLEKYSEEADE